MNTILGLNNDLTFTVGSIVECKTCFEEVLTGEVLAFEYQNKILMLKNPSSTPSSNITCINLEFCSDLKIIKDAESNSNNTKFPDMNVNKLEERAKAAIKERNNLIEAYKSGVSSDGISLYLSLIKTIGGSVTFESFDDKGLCIVIKKNTKITPPYRVDCVQAASSKSGPMSAEAIKYARQLVEKFWRDQNKDPHTLTTPSSSGSANHKTTATIINYNSNTNNTSNNNLKESPPNSGILLSSSGSSPTTTTSTSATTTTTNTNMNIPNETKISKSSRY